MNFTEFRTYTENYGKALQGFISSDSFQSGVVDSTKASFKGSHYSVEIQENGTFRVLPANSIGNLYQSEGLIIAIPTLDVTDLNELQDEAAMSEDEAYSFLFDDQLDDLKEELEEALELKLYQVSQSVTE